MIVWSAKVMLWSAKVTMQCAKMMVCVVVKH